MTDILPKSFYDLENRVEELYKLIPLLIIENDGDEEDLHCVFCRNILIRAYKCNCPHHFCGPCIVKLINKKCPLDNKVIDPRKVSHREDEKSVERRVVNLLAQCPKEGCNVTVPLINMMTHYKMCQPHKTTVENSKKNSSKKSKKTDDFKNLSLEFQNCKDEMKTVSDSIHQSIDNIEDKLHEMASQITLLQQKMDKIAVTVEQHQLQLSQIDDVKEIAINNSDDTDNKATFQISYKKQSSEEKTLLKSQDFQLSSGYKFHFRVFTEIRYLGFNLSLLPSVTKLKYPLNGKIKIVLLSSSNEKWISNSIKISMAKSNTKTNTELQVPKFIPLQVLESHLAHKKTFKIHLTITIDD
ncbi:hypothetical protein CHUAL_006208 [Chamberlinius hualienensis]